MGNNKEGASSTEIDIKFKTIKQFGMTLSKGMIRKYLRNKNAMSNSRSERNVINVNV